MRRYIDPQDFVDLRRQSRLTRRAAAAALDVTPRTIQNWETGGARIPWMAFRMLRILTGAALPGAAWDCWTVRGDRLIAPNGRWFDAAYLEQFELVYSMARLWRQDYAKRNRTPSGVVLAFPAPLEVSKPLAAQKQIGGVR